MTELADALDSKSDAMPGSDLPLPFRCQWQQIPGPLLRIALAALDRVDDR